MIAPADLRACLAALDTGSRSFRLAARLLPRQVADHATGLYAFCRIADDLIDEAQGGPTALAELGARLAAAARGMPADDPADRALAAVLHDCAIPASLVEALLEGFQWDASGRRYATLTALEAYAARVAGSIGVMMALIMGDRRPEQMARACDLGIAMQLTNIVRDVGEDARNGRLYLPRELLAAAGIDPERFLAAPRVDPALAGVLEILLTRAEQLYRRAAQGIEHLPGRCRPGIRAAAGLYRAIGAEVVRVGHDSVTRRARVPARRKLGVLARALLAGPSDPVAWRAEPIAAARFLMTAAQAAQVGHAGRQSDAAGAVAGAEDSGIARVLALFIRLGNADHRPVGAREVSG